MHPSFETQAAPAPQDEDRVRGDDVRYTYTTTLSRFAARVMPV